MLKRAFTFLFCLSLMLGIVKAQQTANILYTVGDFTSNPKAFNLISLTPLFPYGVNGSVIVGSPTVTLPIGTNGSTTYSNVLVGRSYLVQLRSSNPSQPITAFTNAFPLSLAGTNTIDASQWVFYTFFTQGSPLTAGGATNVLFQNSSNIVWQIVNGTNYFYVPSGTFDVYGAASSQGAMNTNNELFLYSTSTNYANTNAVALLNVYSNFSVSSYLLQGTTNRFVTTNQLTGATNDLSVALSAAIVNATNPIAGNIKAATNGFGNIVTHNAADFSGTNVNYNQITNPPVIPSTNNLASTNFVLTAINGATNNPQFMFQGEKPAITNQLASTNYVQAALILALQNSTNLNNSLSNALVQYLASATNGAATVGFVTNLVGVTSNGLYGIFNSGTNQVTISLTALINSLAATTTNNLLNASNSIRVLAFQQATNAAQAVTNGLPALVWGLGTASQSNASAFITPFQLGQSNAVYALTTQFTDGTNKSYIYSFGLVTNLGSNISNSFTLLTSFTSGTNAAYAYAVGLAAANTNYSNSRQAGSSTLTNLSNTGAFTNPIAAGTNLTLSTNSGVISFNATNQTFLTNNTPTRIELTNAIISATNFSGTNQNSLFVLKTNGTAIALTVQSNVVFQTATNVLISQDIIGVRGAQIAQANGTYRVLTAGILWTNYASPGFSILLSGGNYYIRTNITSLYQSTIVNTNWTMVIGSGAGTPPICAYGWYFDINGVVFIGAFDNSNFVSQAIALIGQYGITNGATYPITLQNTNNQFSGSLASFSNLVALTSITLNGDTRTVWPSGGGTNSGSATNVFFLDGNNTHWRLVNGSNVVDVVGVLTNSTTGNAATATTAATAATATTANAINSATTTVVVNGATAPTSGQVLTATSGTAATWQTPSGAGFVNGTANGTSQTNMVIVTPTITSPSVSGFTATSAANMNGFNFTGWNYLIPGVVADGTIIGETNDNLIIGSPANGIILWGQSNILGSGFSMILDGYNDSQSGSYSLISGMNLTNALLHVFGWSDGTPATTITNNSIEFWATNGMYLNGQPLVSSGASSSGNILHYRFIINNGQTAWGFDARETKVEAYILPWGTNYFAPANLNIFFTNLDYLTGAAGSNSVVEYSIVLHNCLSNSVNYSFPKGTDINRKLPHFCNFYGWFSEGGALTMPTNIPKGVVQEITFKASVEQNPRLELVEIRVRPRYATAFDPIDYIGNSGESWLNGTNVIGDFTSLNPETHIVSSNLSMTILYTTNAGAVFGNFPIMINFNGAKIYEYSNYWDDWFRYVGTDVTTNGESSQYQTYLALSNNNSMAWEAISPGGYAGVPSSGITITNGGTNVFFPQPFTTNAWPSFIVLSGSANPAINSTYYTNGMEVGGVPSYRTIPTNSFLVDNEFGNWQLLTNGSPGSYGYLYGTTNVPLIITNGLSYGSTNWPSTTPPNPTFRFYTP